jgi:Ca2+-binding EF-hand superfamily protein
MAASGPCPEFSILRSMKRPGLIPPSLAATLFLLLTPVASLPAQEMMATTPAAKAARKADELLKRFDKNGDGRLDDDERADAKDVMMQDNLDRQMARISAGAPGGAERFRALTLELFDRNKDGRLDDDERTEAEKFAETRRDPATAGLELTRSFDRNKDGRLDADERSQAEAFLAELRTYGTNRMRSGLLRQFDRNADGKVDDTEMAALEKTVRPRMESTPLQRRRYDANGNQKIDDAEWAVARTKIAAWLNGTGPAALENEPARPAPKAKR